MGDRSQLAFIHTKRVVFQMAEVAIPRPLFAAILRRSECLRLLTPGP